MDLKDWLECADYRITEGDTFGWKCWGHDAYSLSSWNGDHDGYSLNITFDTKTQVVYCVEACDYKNQRAYRYINKDYLDAYMEEVGDREDLDMAWDDTKWVDLEDYDDWREKATAIVMGIEYDTRVKIPLDMSKDKLFELMKLAHEQDITLNQLVEKAIINAIQEYERDPEGMKAKAEIYKKEIEPHGY